MRRRSHRGDEERTGEASLAMADLARLRQAAYRLFGQSLLYPDERRLENMATAARGMKRECGVWAGFAFFREWSQYLCALEALRCQDPVAVQGDYVSRFVASRPSVPCPLHESAYLGDDPSATGWLLAQLESEYAQVGLSPSPVLRELPDHAAMELEFMSFLCGREAEAWQECDPRRAIASLERQRGFLGSHLSWWFPQLAHRVAATSPDGVFAVASRAIGAFLVHDADLLDTLLQRFERVKEVSWLKAPTG